MYNDYLEWLDETNRSNEILEKVALKRYPLGDVMSKGIGWTSSWIGKKKMMENLPQQLKDLARRKSGKSRIGFKEMHDALKPRSTRSFGKGRWTKVTGKYKKPKIK